MKQFYSFDQDKWVWIPDTKKPLFYHSWQNSVFSIFNIANNTVTPVDTDCIGPHQILAATKTLFQPGGGEIMPTMYWCPHQVLKATRAPAMIIDQKIGIIIDMSNLFTY